MAYSEKQAENIRQFFFGKGIDFSEKKMFSGICFMVDDKMCCGTHTDKTSGEEFLLCRIGEEEYEEALKMDHCIPMNFTGKAMKGYVFITGPGLDTLIKLSYWLQKCLDFNPKAKKSKK